MTAQPSTRNAADLRAELLRKRLAGQSGTARRDTIPRADRDGVLPLSHGQQQMWFLSRLDPNSVEYLVPLMMRLRGPLDTDALRRAWEHVCARHEVLRTRIELRGVEPVQVIDPARPVALPEIDLTGLPETEVEAFLRRDLQAPFDLAADWPVRGALLRLGQDHHVLAVVFHHVACDAWSTRMFGSELSVAYNALLRGETPFLPELPVQYADFAQWQGRELAGERGDRELSYWRQRLSGLEPISLPIDRPRPAVRSSDGADVVFDVPADLAELVRERAREFGTTAFTVLISAYQAMLARFSGSDDVAVGTVVSGRTHADLQRVFGYCINTLVMRAECDGSFADLLRRGRSMVLDAFDHHAVPFARLVDELQPDRDQSRTPIFQTAFTLHEYRLDVLQFAGLTAEPFGDDDGVAKYDLTLQMQERPDGTIHGRLQYATALFDPDTADRLAAAFQRVLAAAVTDPEVPLSRIEILSPAELAEVVVPPVGGPAVTRTAHEFFEARVAENPDAIAVVAGDVRLTYAEVNARANRLAWLLRDAGVGPEDLVGVHLDRGVDLIPTLLGVLKSGAGYLPLDPANPLERLAYVLEDAGARIVVTSPELAEGLTEVFAGRVTTLPEDGWTNNPPPVATPENVIYTIYTSGSTGKPKGCVLTHANVVRLMEVCRTELGIEKTDVWSMMHSYAFDFSVFEMWGALMYGGTVVVVPRSVARSPEDFFQLLVDEKVTFLSQTPTAFRSLTPFAGDERLSLKSVVFGGEKLEIAEIQPWAGKVALVNMYGITETTVHVTVHELTAQDLANPSVSPAGVALPDLSVYLLDQAGQPVPIGVPGEIYVAGPGVARGYLGRPSLTAQRFLPDPYGEPGTRMYRSGDLARWTTEGKLEFLGRADDQVKIRGFRIELGEVSAALSACAGVREAVTVLAGDRLVGYLVTDGDLDRAAIREELSRTLPEYMVPAALVEIDAIPLTTNGKLDRKALPAPDGAQLRAAGEYVAPRTPAEEAVAAVWRAVLGADRVGVTDSFFELGGDSMRAVALVGALREAGYPVSVRDVFEYRTVARLVEFAGEVNEDAAYRPVQPFELIDEADRALLPDGIVDAYPLGQNQLGMVIEMLADDGQNNYHNVSAYWIHDDMPFMPGAFAEAGRIVLARHDVLRTSIELTAYSRPMQLVHAHAEMTTDVWDCSGKTAEQVRAEVQEFGVRERANPFDMSVPGLMRFHAHTTTGLGGWWLSLVECHPILEGWSYHSLLMEFVTTYLTLRAGDTPEQVEAPPIRFADAIAGELAALESEEDRAYWRDLVRGHAPLSLPAGWGDPEAPASAPYKTGFSWRDLESGLRGLAVATDTSMKAVMLAAHLKVMSQLTEEESFHSGLVCDVRPEVTGADRVYGMFLNTLPFPYARGARTWGDLVRDVFAAEVDLWGHRRFPLPAVLREWQGSGRIMDVYFNYQDFRQLDTEVVDAASGMDDSPTEFPLTVASRAGYLILTANRRHLTTSAADNLAAMYRAVLQSMASEGARGDALAVYLSPAERAALTAPPVVRPETDVLAHELFEARAAERPDAIAVVAGDVELTYAEVNARANRLAWQLRDAGVGAEDLVGVHLERGVDLVPTLLGVLKSGAGYLPLDPANPLERLGYVLEDAGAEIVITSPELAPGLADVFDGKLISVADESEGRTDNPPRVSTPDGVIYTIYTSGSTGRPKGVVLSHRNVTRLLDTAQEHYSFTEADVWSMAHSYAFDVSVFEMWGALAFGGRLVVVPRSVARSPEDFLNLLLDQRVTVLSQTPTAFRSVVTAAGEGDERIDRLDLRAVIFAGEKLEVAELKPWVDRVGLERVALVNMYGITETTVHTTYHRLDELDIADPGMNRVGDPLSDLAVYLLDASGHPVPFGVSGEIYVAGPGVARGYLGRPSLTAQRFVPDPFGPAGSRMYRSGDLARRRADGTLEFLGRADDQVKIRGFRIELGEISAVLAACDGVREAVTVVSGDGRLVGYLVPADGQTPDPRAIRETISRTLPEYMVPAAFVEIDAIPLTNNGKLDRRALPAPGEQTYDADRYVAPRTPDEERMASIWAHALKLDRVGVEDDFFELGGDSIRAVSLVGALQAAGFAVGVLDVFEHTTVAALCASATGNTILPTPVRAVAPFELISDEDRARLPEGLDDAYPLLRTQTGMLVETLASGAQANYHDFTSFLVRDDAPFDAALFREAVTLVARRHDILRTSADLTGFSVPMQLVHHEVTIPVACHDLRDVDPAELRGTLEAFAAAERANPFDLSTPLPLLRINVHVQTDDSWRLSFTKSHALLEGWSYHQLLKELVEALRGLRAGAEIGYDAPPVRFADTVAAELTSLASDADRDFWNGMVAEHEPLSLPTDWHGDLTVPAERIDGGFSFADLEPGLRELAATAGVPFKAVLLGAHLKVLSQITGAEKFFTGLVGHVRPEVQGSERLIGMYITTLPHPYARDAATWGDLARRVFEDETAAWPHRNYPMPAIASAGQRLIDTFFSYLDFHLLDDGDVVDEGNGINRTAMEFGLAVTAIGGVLGLRSNTHLLSRRNIDRIAGMYRAVLEGMAADGDGGDARATYLPPAERAVVVIPPVEGPAVLETAHEFFEARAAENPDAIAVVAGETRLTYAEVNARANQLAWLLRDAGVGPEDLVGVHLERGPDLIPTLLGVLKSGAGYLPLDPANPMERLGYVVADAGAEIVVTSPELASGLSEVFDGRLIEAPTEGRTDNPPPVATPENVIYTIYTSGSTGKPKGCVLTHANVVRLMEVCRTELGIEKTDVWSMMHSYAFDFSVFEMWGALMYGGTVVVVPRSVARSPEDFFQLLVDEKVTFLSQTPTAFRSLTPFAGDERLSLKSVVFGGEKLEIAEIQPWAGKVALVNMYGITETTVHVTVHELTAQDLANPSVSPAGVALPDLSVYLLDQAGQPVPIGVPGEIYVAGPGVARGYLGRPSLTAQRFLPDPYGEPGTRMYRSGDLARWTTEGKLEFLGRADDQVKIRGFRIELGEISAALSACDGVREAVTVLADGRLVGYLVPASGRLDTRAIRETVSRTLPDYMVPAALVEIDAIPLTTNGKLDRKALPAPDGRQLAAATAVAPRTPLEQQLALIWAQVLGLPEAGVEDSFFDLGGDSIRAVSLVGAVRAAGHDISVTDVFERRTVAGLAELIGSRTAPAEPHRATAPFELISEADRALVPDGVADAYPMLQAQAGMLFELEAGESAHYHSTGGYKVIDEAPFDVDALRAAVRAVCARHEALRTSFDLSTYSIPLQLVHERAEPPVGVVDLRGLDDEARDAALNDYVTGEQSRPIDPAAVPQLRIAALVADDGWWLALSRSHMITEGWSQHEMLMELVDCYRALRDGAAPERPESLGVRFADTVAAELAALESPAHRGFWQGVVDDRMPFRLPAWGDADAPDEAYQITVPAMDLEGPLRALAMSSRTSVKSVLLAAHLKVLSQLTNEPDFHAGLVCDTRLEVLGADRVHGMFLNTLPFPYDRSAGTWRELVRGVFDAEVAMWPHRRYPMAGVSRLAGGTGRLVDVIFNYQDFHNLDGERIDLAAGFGTGTNEFGLTVTTSNGGLTLKTRTSILSRAHADRLASMYRQVLEAMAADPDGDATRVFLPAGDVADIAAWEPAAEGTVTVKPVPLSLVEQAARTPRALAVRGNGFEVTFADLVGRAGAVATQLRNAGVSRGDRVGVLVDRGPWLHAAMLGAWFAGAAYVPVDPGFPAARALSMLDGATALITDADSAFDGPVVQVEGLEPVAFEPVEVDPDELAYVIYTSGSTGKPKGVAVPHRGLANHVGWAVRDLAVAGAEIGGGTGGAVFSSVAFDLVVPNVWAPLLAGQPVEMLPQDLDLSELGARLHSAGPFAFLKLTPGHLEVLSHQLTPEQVTDLAGVIVVAGEALPGTLAGRYSPSGRIVNEYGPTEASVGTCIFPVPADPGTGVAPIGAPLPGMVMRVLDERLNQVPVGALGELCVGGAGVAQGYVDRPALTAQRFVPDPYGPAGSRLYRSGDVVRWRGDGVVEYLGRSDDQVKIRGYRVEIGEIEAVLNEHPSVTEARVLLNGGRLIAYLVGASEGVAAFCEQRLPEYMVPAAFVELDVMPLNANGKVDRRALPEPPAAGAGAVDDTPMTAVETVVAGAFERALNTAPIGRNDRFFERGGDSIRAVAVVGALRGHGYDLTVRDVFAQKTVADLAAVLAGRGAGAAAPVGVAPYALISAADRALLPAGTVDAYPLGEVQLGMVAEYIASGERRTYHNVAARRILDDRPFDEAAFRRAVEVITARHDSLRTSVHLTGYSVPMQIVHGTAEVPVRVVDARGADERLLTAEVDAERANPMDFRSAPLLRLAALVENDTTWWLLYTTSHVITDGWSGATFEMELANAYREIRDTGAPAPYEPPAVRYADVIAGELASLRSPEDAAFWQRVVEEHARFDVPASWAGAPGDNPEAYGVSVPIDDLSDVLRSRAAEAGVPFKTLMLATHLEVLGRVSGAAAFHTGVVFHGRPEAIGAERVLGMHLNSLPFPHRSGARTWRELLTRVLEQETEVWAHRQFPLSRIQKNAAVDGRLIDVLFNYIDFHQVDHGVVDQGVAVNQQANDFGLSVHAYGDRRIGIATNTGLLARQHAEQLAALYRSVLTGIAAGLDEEATVLHDGDPVAHDPLAHELFEARVAADPDAVAVVAGDDELTYAEVNARANRLAWLLRDAGVGPEDLVGVHLDRGVDLVPTLLGVLKSGAGYLPLDPANPVERLGYVLEDAGASIVVTSAELAPGLADVFDGTLILPPGEGRTDNPPRVSTPENVIYTIYTSGSTGKPKGVVLSHRNVTRLLDTAQEHYDFDESDVWSMAHSYAFDVSVFEMWGALAFGGRLVVVPRDVSRSPDDFLNLLVDQQVTILSQTPTAFRSVVNAAADGDRRIKLLSLRAVIFAGEKLEIAELKPWVDRVGLGRVALVNMYGITETTVHTTYHRLTKRDLAPGAGNPIGRPLSDLEMHLLDEDGNPVPAGVTGEIYVSGPGVARGYLGRPSLTAQRFVPDPYGPAGSRMYRSGDLAQQRPDGTFEFFGRADDQVKIRGFRIELGEISAAISGCDGVREAVTVLGADGRLVGYLVPADGQNPDPRAIRETISRTLPEYMVPAALVGIAAIPLTTNGKLDKRALPAPEASQWRSGGEYVAPRTPVEASVSQMWQSVLGIDRAGVTDSFFDIGGDSIRAVVLVGTLRDHGYDVEVKDLMRHPVLGELCALLAQREGAPAPAEPVRPFSLISEDDRALLPDGLDDAYPLLQAQTGMQVEMLVGGEHPPYHVVTSVRIRDGRPFDAERFRAAAALLVPRHDVLRSTVSLDGYSTPMQLVHTEVPVHVPVADLSGLDEAESAAEIGAFVAEAGRHPLDPAGPPLLKLAVHLCADGSWQLTAINSHVVLDGWSRRTLFVELFDAYHALLEGRPVEWAPPSLRFADTVAAELAALASESEQEFWRSQVENCPRFALPAGWGVAEGEAGGTIVVDIPFADLEEGLRTVAARAGAPMKSTLLAAHLNVLSGLTPETSFLSGLTHHVRPESVDADRVHGMFLNVLPLRHDRGARTWRDLVAATFAREREVWAHRHFPMPQIERVHGDGGRMIEAYFSFHDFTGLGSNLDGTVAEGDSLGHSSNEFGLSISTGPGTLHLRCNAQLLSREHVSRLASMYRSVLEAMAADPEGDATRVFLPVGEAETVAGWEVAAEGAVTARPVPVSFAEQAARTPDAVAVRGDGFALSFAELLGRAGAVAAQLRKAGVSRGDRVGVLVDRGPWLHAAMLGAWFAGTAYVPVDPGFPANRVESMLDGAAALVTDADSAFDGPVVRVEGLEPVAFEPVEADPDELAYVIYTSGSTGKPKGVAVSHRGLANHVGWAVRDLAVAGSLIGGGTGGAVFSSVAFDLVVPNVWAPLLAGQPVEMLPQDLDLSELGARLLAAGPFAFLKLTPGHLEVLSHQLSPEQVTDLAGVMVVAGEALPGALAGRYSPAGRLVNEYGPTEASVGTCIHRVPADPGSGVVPIGAPLPGMVMRVLDERLNRVPVGAVGELFVGGEGVARGYLDRPTLTAQRFVPDPYGPAGSRLYRSGDVVRWHGDGVVEYLGRSDDQVKIRGYRVEIGEIEAVLNEHPAVTEARVLLVDDRLTAYVVGSAAGLRAFCDERLPDYMVPAAFVELDVMPLNANGKLDRRALPEHTLSADDFEPPATDTERGLAEVFTELLGVERVGRGDGFLALGGHSILVIKAVATAQRRGIPLSLFMMYQHRTLAALGEAVDEQIAAEAAAKAAPQVEAPGLVSRQEWRDAMERHHVPGLSVAVIAGGELVEVETFGQAAAGVPVTGRTPFQAGSLSKHLTALAVLRLVEEGRLDLDEDVNRYLTGWQVPAGDRPVTLRHLLAHRSGLSPTPGGGFVPGAGAPSLTGLLDGVTRIEAAGAGFRKANVHYVVVQQVLSDVTGEPFDGLMRRLVLDPLNMVDSSFDQDHPARSAAPVAHGHDAGGEPIEGGWRVRPDAAAAGLWSTPADLARVAIELRRAALGRPRALLSRDTATLMLTPYEDSLYGLGTVVDSGADTEFGHGGTPTGFHGLSVIALKSGDGLCVMTNGDAGEQVVKTVAAKLRSRR